jgi:hypothetical protein
MQGWSDSKCHPEAKPRDLSLGASRFLACGSE